MALPSAFCAVTRGCVFSSQACNCARTGRLFCCRPSWRCPSPTSFKSRSIPYRLLIRFRAISTRPVYPWVALFAPRQTCVTHVPSGLNVRHQPARPRRYNRRNRRSSDSHWPLAAVYCAPDLRGAPDHSGPSHTLVSVGHVHWFCGWLDAPRPPHFWRRARK